jgi:hypothetical protein
VTRLTSRLAIAATVIVLLPAIVFAGQGITVRYDPEKPDKKSAKVWLAYLLFRMAFREDQKLPIPAKEGEMIVPTFEEEVHARKNTAQVYRELKAKERDLQDSYWETISEVDRRGFMGAYVWTFLRRPQWPTAARPANLAAFEAWKKQALPKHKPQTYGWLEAGKP